MTMQNERDRISKTAAALASALQSRATGPRADDSEYWTLIGSLERLANDAVVHPRRDGTGHRIADLRRRYSGLTREAEHWDVWVR